MPTKETQPNMLDLFRGMLDDHLGKEEFIKAFKQVIDHVKAADDKTTTAVQAIAEALQSRHDEMMGENSAGFEAHKSDAIALIGSELTRFESLLDSKVQPLADWIASYKPLDEEALIRRAVAAVQMPEEKEILLDDGEEIRNKLEVLDGDERLKIEAIKDLREELDKLKKEMKGYNSNSVGIGSTGGKIVKVYDLSASLDGVLKTFALPTFWRVLTVDLSSFPNTLRPTTDYTTDATAMTITFTDEVDAASTLATGQTCIITYSE